MASFREMYGAVYVFENPEAKRVKVGMTINRVADRLQSVNDVWLGRSVTCQVCGTRRLAGGRDRVRRRVRISMPQHPSQHGRPCPGSNALPLEQDVSLAEGIARYEARTRFVLTRLFFDQFNEDFVELVAHFGG
jgi:hypothetical protein